MEPEPVTEKSELLVMVKLIGYFEPLSLSVMDPLYVPETDAWDIARAVKVPESGAV
jgi:hypothetical protein